MTVFGVDLLIFVESFLLATSRDSKDILEMVLDDLVAMSAWFYCALRVLNLRRTVGVTRSVDKILLQFKVLL